jgi:hypothetical protein
MSGYETLVREAWAVDAGMHHPATPEAETRGAKNQKSRMKNDSA